MSTFSRQRRKALLRLAERLAMGLVALDILMYFALFRPLRSRLLDSYSTYSKTYAAILSDRAELEAMTRLKAELPTSNANFNKFLGNHIPPRREGFSDAMELLRKLSHDSGMQIDAVSYKLHDNKLEPLDRLGIRIEVEGTFAQVLRFVNEIETNKDFLQVRQFMFQLGDSGVLDLKMEADLYLTR